MKYKVLKEFLYAFEDEVAKHATLDDIVDLSPYQSGSYLVDLLAYGFIEKHKPDIGRFIPDDCEDYYYIEPDGCIATTSFLTGYTKDEARIAMGNCYQTDQEAQRARSIILLKQEIKDFAFEYNDGWVADWDGGGQGKYYSVYNTHGGEWYAYVTKGSHYLDSTAYFKDRGFLEPLLEKFGARMDLLKPETK